MAWFSTIKSFEELKKEYRRLAMLHHPDLSGGNTVAMQQINQEYDCLFPVYQALYNRSAEVLSNETAKQTRNEFYTQNGWQGGNYSEGQSTADIAGVLREYVKRAYPDHKFSITTQNYSGGSNIRVALMSAPYEALSDGEEHVSLNRYYLSENKQLTPRAKEVMQDINKLINSYRYSDCDGMIDYFDVNFYYDLSVGKWNKPFEVKERRAARVTELEPVPKTAEVSDMDFAMLEEFAELYNDEESDDLEL